MTTTPSLLRWTFVRDGQALTCEISVNSSKSYDVSVVPHWDVSASAIEPFTGPANALRRHAELAWSLRQAGWRLIREKAEQELGR